MNTGIGDAINLAWKLAAVRPRRRRARCSIRTSPSGLPFAQRLVATTDRAFEVVTNESRIAQLRARADAGACSAGCSGSARCASSRSARSRSSRSAIASRRCRPGTPARSAAAIACRGPATNFEPLRSLGVAAPRLWRGRRTRRAPRATRCTCHFTRSRSTTRPNAPGSRAMPRTSCGPMVTSRSRLPAQRIAPDVLEALLHRARAQGSTPKLSVPRSECATLAPSS